MALERSQIEIVPVKRESEIQEFIQLPYDLYKEDANFVAPLKISVRDLLNKKKNPFYRHAEAQFFLARRDGKTVGRIAGIRDFKYNDFHNDNCAFFGFFEAIDDFQVASSLFSAVKEWGKERKVDYIMGPFNPSTNHECGLLVEGFDDPPVIGMTYNPRYYLKLFESCEFSPHKDMLAYVFDRSTKFPQRIMSHIERLEGEHKFTYRTIRMDRFAEELQKVFEIYNDAWEKIWGFVPFDYAEIEFIAREFRQIADPSLVMFAELEGEPVGFALTLPDVNQVLKKIPSGKLLPFGFLKLLWHLKGPFKRKTVTRSRILALGFKKRFQPMGLGPLLYNQYERRLRAAGYEQAEASWVLEENVLMNKALRLMGAKPYKRYRIYRSGL